MSKLDKPILWVLTEIFYPEETSTSYIMSKISDRLSGKYDVKVICSNLSYGNINDSFKISSDIEIKRVIIKKDYDKNKLFHRVLRLSIVSFKLLYMFLKNVRRGDNVIVVTNPAPLLLGVCFFKRIKKYRLNILVHDVFPENALTVGFFSAHSFVYKFLKYLFDKSYSQADKLIVLGRDMKNVMQKKVLKYSKIVQVQIIENWADIINVFPKNNETTSKVHIQYAGNIGRVQNLGFFVRLFCEVKNSNLVLEFYGGGAVESELKDIVKRSNMNTITFNGNYSRDQQSDILNSCDVALITLVEDMYGLGVPSKAYNVMAAGKPILFVGNLDSEIALLVKEHNIGFCFSPKDENFLKEFLNLLSSSYKEELLIMGNRARQVAERYYSEKFILDKFENNI